MKKFKEGDLVQIVGSKQKTLSISRYDGQYAVIVSCGNSTATVDLTLEGYPYTNRRVAYVKGLELVLMSAQDFKFVYGVDKKELV